MDVATILAIARAFLIAGAVKGEEKAHFPAFAITGFTGRWGLPVRPPVVLRFSGGGDGGDRRSKVAAPARRRTRKMQKIISVNSRKIR